MLFGLAVEIPTAGYCRPTGEARARHLPKARPMEKPASVVDDRRWRHQNEAVQTFLEKGAGILEMATGTGKT